jgi:hypothetical protein
MITKKFCDNLIVLSNSTKFTTDILKLIIHINEKYEQDKHNIYSIDTEQLWYDTRKILDDKYTELSKYAMERN